MAWWNPASWFGSVQYRNVEGNHVYELTDPAAAKFLSAFRGGHSEESYLTAFISIPELFAVVDAIASRVMNGKFYVRRKSDGADITRLKPHLKRLLENPSALVKGDDFRYLMVVYKIVCGNRYTYKKTSEFLADNYQGITALFQLRPEKTDIILRNPRPDYFSISTPSDYIKEYVTYEDGRRIVIDPEFVLHDSDIALRLGEETVKGQSSLRAAEYPISNLCVVYEARNVIYVRTGPRVVLVSRKHDNLTGSVPLTDTEKKQALTDLHTPYGLQHGKSPIAISSLPLEVLKVGANIAELEPFEETRNSMYAIAATQCVPRSVLPSEKGTTFANAGEEEKALYENRVIPEAQEICDVYNSILGLTTEPFEIAVSFEHVAAMQAVRLKSAQAENYESDTANIQYEKGLITKNECREKQGLQPVEGEDYYIYNDPNKIKENAQQNKGAAQQSSAN